ncbi:MAG: MBL fold metallo-hydrolase [Candidatus Micrarchaeota archaeon]|nr:MBL fold metallo-hydrolase [Candidatus Micrarchaeota archaeon]MCX8154332.1 MBL fold metallo-hydrolase [Candidatus Micrarchaeota archaeon]
MEIRIVGPGGTRDLLMDQPEGFGTGGFYVSTETGSYYVDPGPGALYKINRWGWGLRIDRIVCSHFHLDHYGDLLAMIEYSTRMSRKIDLITTEDVWNYIDPYHKGFSNYIDYRSLKNTFPIQHGIDGFGIYIEEANLLYTSDGVFHSKIPRFRAETMIANLTIRERIESIEHMSIADLERFIDLIRPKHVILYHYSKYLLPDIHRIAYELSEIHDEIQFYVAKEREVYVL